MITQKLREFRQDTQGVAAIEFAISLPLLLLLFFGGYEYARYMLIHVKMENLAFTVSDIITQQTSITTAQLDQYMSATSQIMLPYSFDEGSGGIIISSVAKNANQSAKVQWQYAYDSMAGKSTRTSRIGTENNSASLPNDFTLNTDEMVIVTEVFYGYTPTFIGRTLEPSSIYKTAVFKPRLGTLTTAPNE